MAALILLWAIVTLLTSGVLYGPVLNLIFTQSIAFTLLIVISFIVSGVFGIGLILLVIRLEHVQTPRRFFKIERLDIKGVWLAAGLVLAFDVASAVILRQILFLPISNYLATLGISAEIVGVTSAAVVPSSITPLLALFLTIFLVIFFWIEIPEEMFFRGYVQNLLQDRVGKNAAMFLSALIWDITHLFALGSVAERFFLGLILAYVFKIRQNTTGVMIFHSVGNRSLLLATIIPAIWGVTLGVGPTLLLVLVILIVMLVAVIGGWRALKLDRS